MAIGPARLPAAAGQGLQEFIANGWHGEMGWLAETADRRASPDAMWKEARTAIVLAMNYGPDHDPLDNLAATGKGNISVYARGRDYHQLIKGRLKQLAGQMASRSGWQVKVFVDTAPLMEKPLAQLAGLGWQGKHTNLLSRQLGNWFFLGIILTDGDLPRDIPETDHCGGCRACLDICPTGAFDGPYRLDARRCISYLTIEHDGMIEAGLRAKMGNRIFGCDDCLAVCPWNKFAQQAQEAKLKAQAGSGLTDLAELLALDEAGFKARFAGSPVRRAGHARFLRNCLIAAGNAGEAGLVAPAKQLLGHADYRVRASAVWAIGQLLGRVAAAKMGPPADETDPVVLAEWQALT